MAEIDELKAEIESLRKRLDAAESALKDIASWQHDTLGTRDGKSSPDTETFDRGTRMAFYRCAERARSALSTEGR